MEQLIISLLSGAVGGNAAGKLLKNLDLGVLGNSVAGIVGGGLGGQILSGLGAGGLGGAAEAASGLDIGTIVSQFAGGVRLEGRGKHEGPAAPQIGQRLRHARLGAPLKDNPRRTAGEVERHLSHDPNPPRSRR